MFWEELESCSSRSRGRCGAIALREFTAMQEDNNLAIMPAKVVPIIPGDCTFTSSLQLAPVTALAKPHPLTHEWFMAEFQAGLSIAEILGPDATCCRVEIGGVVIPESLWPHVRPKPGVAVIITRFPQGGSTFKNIISIVAFAALAFVTAGVAEGLIL